MNVPQKLMWREIMKNFAKFLENKQGLDWHDEFYVAK